MEDENKIPDLATLAGSRENAVSKALATLADSPTARALEAMKRDHEKLSMAVSSLVPHVEDPFAKFGAFRERESALLSAALASHDSPHSRALADLHRPAYANLLSASISQGVLAGKSEWERLAAMSSNQSVSLQAWQGFQTEMNRLISINRMDAKITHGLASAMAGDISKFLGPVAGRYAEIGHWESTLTSRLESFHPSWALDGRLDSSVLGFARLTRLSDAAQGNSPFEPYIADLTKEELGSPFDFADESPAERDARALGAGLNPELISFEASTFVDVTKAAGFVFYLPEPEIPLAIQNSDEGAIFDPHHPYLLIQTEQKLRGLVERSLLAVAGESWIRTRISGQMLKKWKERQQEDIELGRPVYQPIQYADFMDLAEIIAQKNNWNDVFSAVFRHKEDFVTSLRRLHPVRKSIAHARPLSKYDILTLLHETSRILVAMGIDPLRPKH